jgi:proline iminopeptidase
MPYLESGAYYHFAEAAPEKPWCLYLHRGPGHNCYDFEQTAGPGLASAVNLIYLDQCGGGHALPQHGTNPVTWNALLDDIEHLRQRLQLTALDLLGHSFGACLAYRYAARHPGSVRRMVLCNQGVSMHRVVASFFARSPQLVADPRLRAILNEINQRPGLSVTERFLALAAAVPFKEVLAEIQYGSAEFRARHQQIEAAGGLRTAKKVQADLIADGLLEVEYPEELRSVACPVLVIGGALDRMPLPEEVRELQEAIPNARLRMFERSAHFPYVEETELFVRAVADFLAGASDEPGGNGQ